MKILLVTSHSADIPYYINTLLEITDKQSIVILNTLSEADKFIKTEVQKKQLELDLILLQNKFPTDHTTGLDFHRKIIFSQNKTYSNYDFNWNSIPVMLLIGRNENRNAYINSIYDDNQVIGFTEKLHLYIPEMLSRVKTWRTKLLDELSNIGIDYKSGLLDYKGKNLLRLSRPTEILSNNFKSVPRRLNYAWLDINYKQIEISIDEFVKELKWSERSSKNDEKRFHRFFNKYPLFLKRDLYRQTWYEPQLRFTDKNESKNFIEPDFALKPSFSRKTDLSILEIKLPQQGFVKKTSFHPSPLSKFMDYLFQVSDYKAYFEDDRYIEQFYKTFGFNPKEFDFHLLVGRKDAKSEAEEILNKRMKQMNMDYINLISYDELMEYQVRFMQHLKLLEIK